MTRPRSCTQLKRNLAAQLGTRTRREHGAQALQAAITGMIGIALVMTILQGWMFYAASNTARSAAQAGLQAARVADGSAGAGRSAALSNATTVGGIANLAVTADRGAQTARVVVTGAAPVIFPGVPLPAIRAEAGGPIERVTR